MSNEEDQAPPPPHAELSEIRKALGRLANAVLKVHYSQQRNERVVDRNEKALERIERKVGENGEKLAVLLKEVDNTQDAIDDVRDDITPPLGIPLVPPAAVAADPVVEVGPVRGPASLWRRVLPFVVLAIVCLLVGAMLMALAFVWPHGR